MSTLVVGIGDFVTDRIHLIESTAMTAPHRASDSSSDDRHDTNVVVDSVNFRVSFLPMLQMVVYTSIDHETHDQPMKAGSFNLCFGWVTSKQPEDFILENELQYHLMNIS